MEFKWKKINGMKVEITGFKGVIEPNLVIPEEIEGLPVAALGEEAFCQQEELESVVIPKTVTKIGSTCFSFCYGLTNVEFLGGVKIIGTNAFMYCSSLTSIVIPDGLEILEDAAFDGCENLKTISLPKTLKEIGNFAFGDCYSLENIEIDEANENYCSFDGAIYTKNMDKIVLYYRGANKNYKEFTVPDGVLEIGENAFWESELEKIRLPEGITKIGQSAFTQCKNLKSIRLPKTVVELEGYDFSGIFQECESLTSIKLHEGITKIPGSTFYRCKNLKSISFSKELTQIGYNAFVGCNFKEFTVSGKIEKISRSVFEYCPSLETVIIEDGVKEICENAFAWCSNLKKVVIPKTVSVMHGSSFFKCNALEEIIIDSENEYYKEEDGKVFAKTTNELILCYKEDLSEEVILPSGIIDLTNEVMQNYTNAKTVIIPDTVKKIGCSAFENMSKLEKIIIPNSVEDLSNSAFKNCKSLKKVELHDKIKRLYSYVFSGCESLEEIILPKELVSISYNAFENCKKLKTIFLPAKLEEISFYNAFDFCDSLTSIEVDENNKQFKSIDGDIYTKNGKTFLMCATGKKELNIAKGTTRVLSVRSRNLTKVTIPNGVERIEFRAFNECYNLTSPIELPDTVTYIGEQAFWQCYKLKSVFVPKSVKFIGPWAFVDSLFGDSITVYCEAEKKPTTWRKAWAYGDRIKVVWGCTREKFREQL